MRLDAQAPVHLVRLAGGFTVSDERGRLDMGFVHASLENAYWSAGRPRALTERGWANSLCFGVYAPGGEQVGFARAITDYALRAHLADVFIRPDRRGHGLGRGLIEAVLAHPALATVTRWTLTTADAQGLYAGYGFRSGERDDDWMTLDRAPRPGPSGMR